MTIKFNINKKMNNNILLATKIKYNLMKHLECNKYKYVICNKYVKKQMKMMDIKYKNNILHNKIIFFCNKIMEYQNQNK